MGEGGWHAGWHVGEGRPSRLGNSKAQQERMLHGPMMQERTLQEQMLQYQMLQYQMLQQAVHLQASLEQVRRQVGVDREAAIGQD